MCVLLTAEKTIRKKKSPEWPIKKQIFDEYKAKASGHWHIYLALPSKLIKLIVVEQLKMVENKLKKLVQIG